MVSVVFSIRDRKSGLYGTPFFAVNEECAKRDFARICKAEVNEFIADDLELYKIGLFDNETGQIHPIHDYDDIEFVCGCVNSNIEDNT